MNNTTYLMNPATGSVDTYENWKEEGYTLALLVEVVLEDGSEVPADFNPCRSSEFDWVEA